MPPFPPIEFPLDLPINHHRQQIAAALASHQVIVVCGETGSGKSTQLPKIALDLGRAADGKMIGHTQPRRIAARSIAARIAEELNTKLGDTVGYKVRFNNRVGRNTAIKVMTDGILLAETQADRSLSRYNTLIIDEAHERNLNVDFLLGYIKQLLPKRPDLKVIITSATIDPTRFSDHFNGAPIVEVSGRTFPVEVRYRPVQALEPDEEDPTVLEAIVRAVDEVSSDLRLTIDDLRLSGGAAPESSIVNRQSSIGSTTPHDILIFLSGEREIRETAEALRKHHPPDTQILPLYARQSIEEQNRVFQLHKGRRIVLATNVAETSLTVPNIGYVIDPGLARISRYSANARVQRLPIEPISQASANQRKGRCGRIAPGVCIRLYSEEDFNAREPFTDPEILRANLASVILQMKALKLGDVEHFPFIDPPKPTMIREGYQTLLELGAVDQRHRITRLGQELARLPVDPRIGRMILAASDEHCLAEALIIASALATQDPRLRPMDAQNAADIAHEPFADPSSDFLSFLKLWDYFQEQSRTLSTSKLRKLCQRQFLSYMRLREWNDVHQQLHALVTESGMKLNTEPASHTRLHRALLAGLLNNVGMKSEQHDYRGPRDRKFNIFPGSALFKKSPKWMMAAELVETNRLYARIVARIAPEWIERVGSHLLKRTHTDPYWNEKSAHVEAFERVSLHGLIIVPKRRVHYGPINPVAAREIFIRQGLVEGAIPPPYCNAPFFVHNRALIEEVRQMEAKTRRRDFMIDEQAVYDFYDRIIPAPPRAVYDGPSFQKWRRKSEQSRPQLLFMKREDLLRRGTPDVADALFPNAININGLRLPIAYQFDPGGVDDGITVTVPLDAIHQISQSAAEWLVPGLIQEKIGELIRTLPKSLRRNFVPVPDFAETSSRNLEFGDGDLLDALASELHRQTGVEVPRCAWRLDQLPDHLRMNFKIVDAEGKTLCNGRDLAVLRRELTQLNAQATTGITGGSESVQSEASLPTQTRFIAWTFGDLPQRIDVLRGQFTVHAYPALVDHQNAIAIELFNAQHTATAAHRAGLRRLFLLQVQDELRAHIEYIPELEEMAVLYSPLGDGESLIDDLMLHVVDRVFINDAGGPDVYTQVEFERRVRSGWDRVWPTVRSAVELTHRILELVHTVSLQLEESDRPPWTDAVADMRSQLDRLTATGFLVQTPFGWLEQYPRYLNAMVHRLRKLHAGNVMRDRTAAAGVALLWEKYEDACAEHADERTPQVAAALGEFRWLIEEFRVSQFAQELRTIVPVSQRRLEEALRQARR